MKKYMIIERFKTGCFDSAYQRYNDQGRMLPAGLHYLNSWVSREHSVCYQLMETSEPDLFEEWFSHWNDLVDFKIIEID